MSMCIQETFKQGQRRSLVTKESARAETDKRKQE